MGDVTGRFQARAQLAKLTKFAEYNLLPSTLILLFININCSEFMFYENYLPSDPHTKRVNLGPAGRSTQNATHGAIFLGMADWFRIQNVKGRRVHNQTRIVKSVISPNFLLNFRLFTSHYSLDVSFFDH